MIPYITVNANASASANASANANANGNAVSSVGALNTFLGHLPNVKFVFDVYWCFDSFCSTKRVKVQ